MKRKVEYTCLQPLYVVIALSAASLGATALAVFGQLTYDFSWLVLESFPRSTQVRWRVALLMDSSMTDSSIAVDFWEYSLYPTMQT